MYGTLNKNTKLFSDQNIYRSFILNAFFSKTEARIFAYTDSWCVNWTKFQLFWLFNVVYKWQKQWFIRKPVSVYREADTFWWGVLVPVLRGAIGIFYAPISSNLFLIKMLKIITWSMIFSWNKILENVLIIKILKTFSEHWLLIIPLWNLFIRQQSRPTKKF